MIAVVFIAMGVTQNPQNRGFSANITMNGLMILAQSLTKIILMNMSIINCEE